MASSNNISALAPSPPSVDASRYPLYNEASILREFLSDINYAPLDIPAINEPLEAAMRNEMEIRSIRCDQLERTLHLSASLIHLAYYDCDLTEKINMGLFNWYLIYVDDVAPKDPTPFSQFKYRFLRGQPQMDPVLDALVDVLLRMCGQYDPLCANTIINSAFDLVTSHCIEPELEALPLIRGAQRFPWFVRERTGAGAAFALMMFVKSANFQFAGYVQALPDMTFWVCLVNDLLSFHKEELAGEKANYIHNRAYTDNKSPLQVTAEMVVDLRESLKIIYTSLAHNPNAIKAWKTFERGYVAWHVAQDRYQLKNLGL